MEISGNMMCAKAIESRVTPFIRRLMRNPQITGSGFVLVDVSEVLCAKGYGYTDWESIQTATPRTAYKIGSITKAFTGTAAM